MIQRSSLPGWMILTVLLTLELAPPALAQDPLLSPAPDTAEKGPEPLQDKSSTAALPEPCRSHQPRRAWLQAAQRAPFDGVLEDPLTSACQGFRIEALRTLVIEERKACQETWKADRELAEEKLEARQQYWRLRFDLVDQAAQEAGKELAKARAPASWWRRPELWFCVGLVAGGALVAVAVRL